MRKIVENYYVLIVVVWIVLCLLSDKEWRVPSHDAFAAIIGTSAGGVEAHDYLDPNFNIKIPAEISHFQWLYAADCS